MNFLCSDYSVSLPFCGPEILKLFEGQSIIKIVIKTRTKIFMHNLFQKNFFLIPFLRETQN